MDMQSHQTNKYIAYVSKRSVELSETDVGNIILESVANNADKGITGILLVRKNYFYQFIEGNEEAINTLYDKLCADSRHHDVHTLISGYENERVFPIWDMHAIHTDEPGNQFRECINNCENDEVKGNLEDYCIDQKPLSQAYL